MAKGDPSIKPFSQWIEEDAPANSAGGGGVAGIGIGPHGEPGVDLRKKRKKDGDDPLTEDVSLGQDWVSRVTKSSGDEVYVIGAPMPDDTFAGASVFTTGMDEVMKSRNGKLRYHRYSRYVGESEKGETIRQHGRSTKNDIVLKDEKTGVMTYLRRKQSK